MQVHKFGECSPSKKFFRADHFGEHLKHSHAGTSGTWLDLLKLTCQKDEVPLMPSSEIMGKVGFSIDEIPNAEYQITLQRLTKSLYPAAIVDYISLSRLINLYEGQLALLKAQQEKGHPYQQVYDSQSVSSYILLQQRGLNRHLLHLKEKLSGSRTRCVIAGHSLFEVDQALQQNHPDRHVSALPPHVNHNDMLEVRRRTLNMALLGSWSTTRDRINGWLLHSLRADDSLARLHRSMLADSDLDEKDWARLVVKYWTLDEAATGFELTASASVGAIHSHEASSLELDDFQTCCSCLEPAIGNSSSEHEVLEIVTSGSKSDEYKAMLTARIDSRNR